MFPTKIKLDIFVDKSIDIAPTHLFKLLPNTSLYPYIKIFLENYTSLSISQRRVLGDPMGQVTINKTHFWSPSTSSLVSAVKSGHRTELIVQGSIYMAHWWPSH